MRSPDPDRASICRPCAGSTRRCHCGKWKRSICPLPSPQSLRQGQTAPQPGAGAVSRSVPRQGTYIISIAGSVAGGKAPRPVSQALLGALAGAPQVELVTTDGFLFPNKGSWKPVARMRRKVPESWRHPPSGWSLSPISAPATRRSEAPVYPTSSMTSCPTRRRWWAAGHPDPGRAQCAAKRHGLSPGPLIACSCRIRRLSIYVDADAELLRTWYIDRFLQIPQRRLRS